MLQARLAPIAAVGLRVFGYAGGLVLSRFATLSPSALSSVYPSKSLVQLYHAVSILPSLISVIIWWLMLAKSPLVLATGLARILFAALSVYITASDSLSWHGNSAALYVGLTLLWMWLLGRHNCSLQGTRRKITFAYLAVLFLFMHFQGHYLSGGDGYYMVVFLRLVQICLDIVFETLAYKDFSGVLLGVGYSKKYEV